MQTGSWIINRYNLDVCLRNTTIYLILSHFLHVSTIKKLYFFSYIAGKTTDQFIVFGTTVSQFGLHYHPPRGYDVTYWSVPTLKPPLWFAQSHISCIVATGPLPVLFCFLTWLYLLHVQRFVAGAEKVWGLPIGSAQ